MCPICLDRFNNLAYLDRCLHRFCFPCIQEWSHNKAECPLCKQPFASILHSDPHLLTCILSILYPRLISPQPILTGPKTSQLTLTLPSEFAGIRL
uniref:E3 ubiquitin-protein ligase Topors n=1 Tax=Mola mola TaxID=94237 RepID=A0A3Q4B948_MOLML